MALQGHRGDQQADGGEPGAHDARHGVTKEELQEIFLHASVYCGFPAAVDAFRAAEVVDPA